MKLKQDTPGEALSFFKALTAGKSAWRLDELMARFFAAKPVAEKKAYQRVHAIEVGPNCSVASIAMNSPGQLQAVIFALSLIAACQN